MMNEQIYTKYSYLYTREDFLEVLWIFRRMYVACIQTYKFYASVKYAQLSNTFSAPTRIEYIRFARSLDPQSANDTITTMQ